MEVQHFLGDDKVELRPLLRRSEPGTIDYANSSIQMATPLPINTLVVSHTGVRGLCEIRISALLKHEREGLPLFGPESW